MNFEDLPSSEQMQRVVRIIFHYFPERTSITMIPAEGFDEEGASIRWSSGDEQLPIVSLYVLSDTIIPIMNKVTGHTFTRIEEHGHQTIIFERDDFTKTRKAQADKLHGR